MTSNETTEFAWSGYHAGVVLAEDIEKELEAEIDRIRLGSALWFMPTGMVVKQEKRKWQVSSAMQKSIRRGDGETAVQMAEGLSTLDPEYCWRRLPVIAMEDIGLADPMLVGAVLWLSGKKAKRLQMFGSDLQALHAIVKAMAFSVKDRSVCDLTCWVMYQPEWQEKRDAAFAYDSGEPKNLFTNTSAFIADRMLAAWAIAGTQRMPGDNLPEKAPGDFKAVLGLCEAMSIPPLIRWIMHAGYQKIGDGMPLAYPLIWEMVIKSYALAPAKWRADVMTTLPKIGYYPSEAFDWHTNLGKRAFNYFNAISLPMQVFLSLDCKIDPMDKKDRIKPTATLDFYVEGSLLDKRLEFEGSHDIRELTELAVNRAYLVPGEFNDWAMAMFRGNLETLHYARLKVLDAVPPGVSVKLPEPFALPKSWSIETNQSGNYGGPGHTDLMASPEALEAFMEKHPSPEIPTVKKKKIVFVKKKPSV